MYLKNISKRSVALASDGSFCYTERNVLQHVEKPASSSSTFIATSGLPKRLPYDDALGSSVQKIQPSRLSGYGKRQKVGEGQG